LNKYPLTYEMKCKPYWMPMFNRLIVGLLIWIWARGDTIVTVYATLIVRGAKTFAQVPKTSNQPCGQSWKRRALARMITRC